MNSSSDFSSAFWSGFTTLDEWLNAIIGHRKDVFPRFCFPCQTYFDEYISNIHSYSNEQVISLLRELLIPYTTSNAYKMLSMYEGISTDDDYHGKIQEMLRHSHWARLLRGENEWEGLTWILELLPYRPLNAINVLSSYFFAEYQYMHDHRVEGISECIDIIEARFINQTSGKEKIIYALKPRDFEVLVEKLYKEMGYDTILTPATRDGGKDIVATKKRPDATEKVYIECKLYKTTRLKPEQINALTGVIIRDCANRGVIFCTGNASNQLKELDPRIQIISLTETILLLNMHLGASWDVRHNSTESLTW